METIKLNLSETSLFEAVLPYLKGHVFHATKLTNLPHIIGRGEIQINENEEFETTFGSTSNSFFRNKGCISLFDYREIDPELFEKHAYKCTPTQAASPECGIAVLIIAEQLHSNLLSWKLWHEEAAHSQMVLPYFETGYPGSIKLSDIIKTIEITVIEDPNSILAAYRRAEKSG